MRHGSVSLLSPAASARTGALAGLAAETLARTGRLRFRAQGLSMLPALRPGDELEFVVADGGYAVGDIVLCHRDEKLQVHRVVSRDSEHVQTQGDAMPRPDPPVAATQVLGRLEAYRRDGRARAVRPPGFAARCCGWCLRRSGWATRMFVRWHRITSRQRFASVATASDGS